jgi:hypothetical protein
LFGKRRTSHGTQAFYPSEFSRREQREEEEHDGANGIIWKKSQKKPDITLATEVLDRQKNSSMPEVQQRFLKEELLVGHIFCSL